MYSAAATAAIAALFNPVPALAAPGAPLSPVAPAVPDVGLRPIPLGTLTMPGQTAAAPTTTPTLIGVANSPVLQKIEKGRAEIATMGDELIRLGQDRDLARDQENAAELKYTQTVTVLQQARAAAAGAAAQSMLDAAALPPGKYDTGLIGLDDLARLQRGAGDTQDAAARELESAETTVQLALDEETLAEDHYDSLIAQYTKLNAALGKKQAAQQALELAHADELSAAESSENAADSQLGAQYLAGAEAGRGADARALQALRFALAQRGDPYVWSEEGPNAYDCSGLMYAAYRSVGFPLMRVSRDQYWQTRNKVVDRYSLLPGDLLFFSYSNSWRGIHHVAMYAGDGYMVEAPRTGLNVRLVPVRWTRLFQATRVFGSVEGVTEGPVLGEPDPEPTTTSATPRPSTSTSTKPSSKPPTSGTPSPSSSTSPSTSPSTSTSPTTSANPTTSAPQPTGNPTTSPSAAASSSTSTGGSSASTPTGATSTSSATAAEHSASASASSSSASASSSSSSSSSSAN